VTGKQKFLFSRSGREGRKVNKMNNVPSPEFRRFEIEFLRNEKLDIKKKFKIVEALYREAVALGVFPLKDSLEGLEVDIRIAKGINSVSKDT
jgi:hypothetical protein